MSKAMTDLEDQLYDALLSCKVRYPDIFKWVIVDRALKAYEEEVKNY